MPKRFDYGNPPYALQDQGIFDSGYSRHITGNKSYLTDYQDIDGGFVAFAESPKGGKITGKCKIRTRKLDFEDVYFDKKNSVLFTKTECLVLSPDFKLLGESQVLLKVPRQNNMYSFDLKNVVPSGGLTCLFAKATIDESNLWHMRLGHINFKTMNKLMRGNLVRDSLLPTTFWAKAVSTACYVQNRVLVTKPHNKTPYELLHGRPPSISFMSPFGCYVTILNTLDPLGKFDEKADEGASEPPNTPTGCTPFRMVYGKSCQLPVEIEHKTYWALKQCNMDLMAAAKNSFMELNELIEL
ncbi:ribonuclease H-like domain-containing protein [Tanacetum coccineum]